MEAIAKTKYLKGSPRKARLVIDMIRGVNVSKALNILKFTDKRAADPIAKTLRSAIANATNLAEKQNIAIDPDDLFVKSCFVDMGPTKHRRRMRPAPQGRAYREQRHYCHITIQVSSDKPEAKDEKVKQAEGIAAPVAEEKKPAAKKTAAKKSDEVKEPKKAKTPKTEDEVSEPAAETKTPKATKASKKVTEEETKGDAQAADAKDTETQQPAELNETKRADDKQEDVNEELERQ